MKKPKVFLSFNDDEIRRKYLPRDVFGILHDLCYMYEGSATWKWLNLISRSQNALRTDSKKRYSPAVDEQEFMHEFRRRAEVAGKRIQEAFALREDASMEIEKIIIDECGL